LWVLEAVPWQKDAILNYGIKVGDPVIKEKDEEIAALREKVQYLERVNAVINSENLIKTIAMRTEVVNTAQGDRDKAIERAENFEMEAQKFKKLYEEVMESLHQAVIDNQHARESFTKFRLERDEAQAANAVLVEALRPNEPESFLDEIIENLPAATKRHLEEFEAQQAIVEYVDSFDINCSCLTTQLKCPLHLMFDTLDRIRSRK
jgi:hypothetical protein